MYYITKYGLTKGIFCVEDENAEMKGNCLHVRAKDWVPGRVFVTPAKYVFRDLREAQKAVDADVVRLIARYEKAIKAMRNYVPSVQDFIGSQ